MPTGTFAQIASLRQKLRRDVSAFQNLIKKGPIESPFSLPANAKLFVRAQSATTVNSVALNVSGKDIYAPALSKDEFHDCGSHGKATIVEVKEGFSLFVLAPWGLLPVPLQTEE